MKKILTLIVAFAATASSILAADMKFIGSSSYYAKMGGMTVSGSALKDPVMVSDNNSAITFPEMNVLLMGQPTTLPSMKIAYLSCQAEGNTLTWEKAAYDTIVSVNVGGQMMEKDLKVSSLKVVYTLSTGEIDASFVFQYGSMPCVVNFSEKGYYTVDNRWNLAGCGTANNPYRLFCSDDFRTIAGQCTEENSCAGEFFQMVNDIDFEGKTFTPIAYSGANTALKATVKFAGSFDGNGKTIRNAVIDDPSMICGGIFGTVDAAGTVKNVIIDNTCSFRGNSYIAGIAGMLLGTIENCINNGTMTSIGTTASGIAGNIQQDAIIKGCVNNGNIQAATYAAGIGGMTIGDAKVEDCINNGYVKVVGSQGAAGRAGAAQHAAGIVGGGIGTCIVKNCTNYGEIINNGFDPTIYPDAYNDLEEGKDGKNVGGIVANIIGSYTITGCKNYGPVTGLYYVAGIIGYTTKECIVEQCVNTGKITAKDITTAGNFRGIDSITLGEDNLIGVRTPRFDLDSDEPLENRADVNRDSVVDVKDINAVITEMSKQ